MQQALSPDYCDANDVCKPQAASGAMCTEDEHCLSYDCVDSICAADDGSDDLCDFL